MEPHIAPTLWAVAGCLFEISLPPPPSGRWHLADSSPSVSLVAEEMRHGQHHFRFRADAAAVHSAVALRFSSGDGGDAEVVAAVRIAPESLDA